MLCDGDQYGLLNVDVSHNLVVQPFGTNVSSARHNISLRLPNLVTDINLVSAPISTKMPYNLAHMRHIKAALASPKLDSNSLVNGGHGFAHSFDIFP
jgi:hypothetical protein